MGLFDINDEKLQGLYHRAWLECNRGYVDPRKFSYLEHAIIQYARDNNCSFDDAYLFAKTGKKLGRLKDQ